MMQRIKVAAVVIAFVLIALCAWGGVLSNRAKNATPTPASAAAAPPPSPLIEPTATPRPTTGSTATISEPTPTQTPKPTATPSQEDQYLTIAKGAAMPDIRGNEYPAGRWEASVINVGEGPELELRMPLNPALSNAQFVRQARRNIAQVVNALFVADPKLFRITAIGTFPDQGAERPAVSIFVYRSKSDHWGTVTADELDTLAERVDIKPRFR